MDASCPLCAAELLGAVRLGEGAQAEVLLDCDRCGLVRLDTASRAMIALAEGPELDRISARLHALRATGDRAVLDLRPSLFVLD